MPRAETPSFTSFSRSWTPCESAEPATKHSPSISSRSGFDRRERNRGNSGDRDGRRRTRRIACRGDVSWRRDHHPAAHRCGGRLATPDKVDVMLPAQDRWFPDALASSELHPIGDLTVRVISAPCFLATKVEAFGDGRRGDYLSSHDIEDVVLVVDGRASIEADVNSAPAAVRDFLRERFRSLLADPEFIDAVAGHLPGDIASQARLPLVLSRMRAIAGLP